MGSGGAKTYCTGAYNNNLDIRLRYVDIQLTLSHDFFELQNTVILTSHEGRSHRWIIALIGVPKETS